MSEGLPDKIEGKTIILQNMISVIGIILCVLFGTLLLCNLVIIINGTLHPERPPSVLGTTPMVVLSGSMSGTHEGHIETGDLIFVGKADPKELQVGDVIAFMEGRSVVTHRIMEVQIGEDGKIQWVTKGDANNTADTEPVPEENLVGIYKMRIPKIGDFALFLQEPLGMVIFMGVPILGYIIYDVFRRQQYAKNERVKAAEMEEELKRLRELTKEQ